MPVVYRPQYMAVLDEYRKHGEARSISDIALATGMSPHTVNRLLKEGLKENQVLRAPAYPPIIDVIRGVAKLPDGPPIAMPQTLIVGGPPPKRGRGRPRKNPLPIYVPVEPVIPPSPMPSEPPAAPKPSWAPVDETASATVPTAPTVPPVPAAPAAPPAPALAAAAEVLVPDEILPPPGTAPEPLEAEVIPPPAAPEPAPTPRPAPAASPRPAAPPAQADAVLSPEYISELERQRQSVEHYRGVLDVANTTRNGAKGLSVSATRILVTMQQRLDQLEKQLRQDIESGSRADTTEILKQVKLAGHIIKLSSEVNHQTAETIQVALGGTNEVNRLIGKAQPPKAPEDNKEAEKGVESFKKLCAFLGENGLVKPDVVNYDAEEEGSNDDDALEEEGVEEG